METLKFLQETDKNNNEINPQKARGGRIIILILAIFMLLGIIGLSSCAVGVRTPRYQRSGVVIERHYRSERPERRVRHFRVEHQDHRVRHNRRDRDD